MRIHGRVLILAALAAPAVRADDAAAARDLIDRAIRAHGGEAAMAKWPVVTVKSEGIFHGHDRTPVFFFTSETAAHGPDRHRSVVDGKITVPNGKPNPQLFRVTNILDGERGWVHMAGSDKVETRDFTAAELARAKESAYAGWVATLLPLKDAAFTLALAGESKVQNEPAVGVRVSSRGRRDVTLFFDKRSHLLVKTETRGQAGTGVEGQVELFLSRYKDVDGVQRPMHLMLQHDGRPLMSNFVLDYQLLAESKAETFAKP